MKRNFLFIGTSIIMLLMMLCSGMYGKKNIESTPAYKDVSVSNAYNMIMNL
jgi:hypothetical protein